MRYREIRYGGSVCDKQEEKAIIKSVKESIKSGGWQSGKNGALMEKESAKVIGVKHGLITTSGSCAGLLALSALELPKGSEVIICGVTFPTIFNIIIQCGLIPVVVDADIETFGFKIEDVEGAITSRTSAIIAIHPVGNPVDMPALMKLVKYRNIKVIEDCCDTWGGSIGGKMLGSFGDISFTSFHAAHIVSMGVGGGVYTNDKRLAKNVKMYRDWGRQANIDQPHTCPTLPKDYDPRFVYEKVGYNFQVLELQAVMGRIQLKKAKKIKALRKKNFDFLYKELSKYPDIILPKWLPNADVCWFAFPFSIVGGQRGELVKHLNKHGIETRSMFAGNILRHPAYKKVKAYSGGELSGLDFIIENSLWIGVHPRMTADDRKYVAWVFSKYFNA